MESPNRIYYYLCYIYLGNIYIYIYGSQIHCEPSLDWFIHWIRVFISPCCLWDKPQLLSMQFHAFRVFSATLHILTTSGYFLFFRLAFLSVLIPPQPWPPMKSFSSPLMPRTNDQPLLTKYTQMFVEFYWIKPSPSQYLAINHCSLKDLWTIISLGYIIVWLNVYPDFH